MTTSDATGGKAFRRLHLMRRKILKNPELVVAGFLEELPEEMQVEVLESDLTCKEREEGAAFVGNLLLQ